MIEAVESKTYCDEQRKVREFSLLTLSLRPTQFLFLSHFKLSCDKVKATYNDTILLTDMY